MARIALLSTFIVLGAAGLAAWLPSANASQVADGAFDASYGGVWQSVAAADASQPAVSELLIATSWPLETAKRAR